MCIKININNPDKKRKLDLGRIKSTALRVLKYFKIKSALVDITFITDKKIRSLNKKYMRRNRPTDVISFWLKGRGTLQCAPTMPEDRLIGDIYVSCNTAYRNAKRFNTSFRKEISLYVIHGVLHLLGFGDKTAKEKNKIRALENKFLNKAAKNLILNP